MYLYHVQISVSTESHHNTVLSAMYSCHICISISIESFFIYKNFFLSTYFYLFLGETQSITKTSNFYNYPFAIHMQISFCNFFLLASKKNVFSALYEYWKSLKSNSLSKNELSGFPYLNFSYTSKRNN